MQPTAIVWFRRDLRLFDNPAITFVSKEGFRIVPVFIWSPKEEGEWAPGLASRWWLHKSLESLSISLEKRELSLVIRSGDSFDELTRLIHETGAKIVCWNRLYEPLTRQRDKRVKAQLLSDGITVKDFNSSLLLEPWEIKNKSGEPYQVFTPFAKNYFNIEIERPIPKPEGFEGYNKEIQSLRIDHLQLVPQSKWCQCLEEEWVCSEGAARGNLGGFVDSFGLEYEKLRDLPGIKGTSRLSPYLHFGQISPNRIWHEAKTTVKKKTGQIPETFLKELIWREFAYHTLYHFPHSVVEPLRKEYNAFPWSGTDKEFKVWQKGMTGYPIVDAGMRELWRTGWVHNRVRMIVASFLAKDLFISWQDGVKWFWDTLVDADLANNTLGWQWTSGCGVDAAPYFRIFNPILQGEKYDPDGLYVKHWLPELRNVSRKFIHRPWETPREFLKKNRVEIGEIYPLPIVNHDIARGKALMLYDRVIRSKKKVSNPVSVHGPKD